MDAPSFTYDNKIITLTHDMTLHITHTAGDDDDNNIDFQRNFHQLLEHDTYFLELMHIIFTKLISNVPDSLKFKLYIYQIPSCMIPYKFTQDAFEILKPIILDHEKTRTTYERFLLGREEEIFHNREIIKRSPLSISSSFDTEEEDREEDEKKDKKKERSMFDLSDEE